MLPRRLIRDDYRRAGLRQDYSVWGSPYDNYICDTYVKIAMGRCPKNIDITLRPATTEGRGVFRLEENRSVSFTSSEEADEFHAHLKRLVKFHSEVVYHQLWLDALRLVKVGGLFEIVLEEVP